MFNWVYLNTIYTIFKNSVIIESIKLTFFSENKFYDRTDSFLTN